MSLPPPSPPGMLFPAGIPVIIPSKPCKSYSSTSSLSPGQTKHVSAAVDSSSESTDSSPDVKISGATGGIGSSSSDDDDDDDDEEDDDEDEDDSVSDSDSDADSWM